MNVRIDGVQSKNGVFLQRDRYQKVMANIVRGIWSRQLRAISPIR